MRASVVALVLRPVDPFSPGDEQAGQVIAAVYPWVLRNRVYWQRMVEIASSEDKKGGESQAPTIMCVRGPARLKRDMAGRKSCF